MAATLLTSEVGKEVGLLRSVVPVLPLLRARLGEVLDPNTKN